MSSRVTRADVETVCENLNRRLEQRKSPSRVKLEGRNGYTAADEYLGSSCLRALVVGTKREVYDALWHMMRGIDLTNNPYRLPPC